MPIVWILSSVIGIMFLRKLVWSRQAEPDRSEVVRRIEGLSPIICKRAR